MRRNRVKKVMAVMLAAGMVSGLAACGGKTAEKPAATPAAKEAAAETTAEAAKGADAAAEELKAEEGAEIEIAYWEGSTSDKDAWDELIANLQKDHPEIKIIPQTYPSSDYRDMLDTRIAGNDWPDVMRYTYQRLGKFKKADVMLDLTPYISQENLDGISPEEKEDFLWLQEHAPELELIATIQVKMRALPRGGEGKVLAIGQKAAYFSRSRHFVNLVQGEGLYGFQMQAIRPK